MEFLQREQGPAQDVVLQFLPLIVEQYLCRSADGRPAAAAGYEKLLVAVHNEEARFRHGELREAGGPPPSLLQAPPRLPSPMVSPAASSLPLHAMACPLRPYEQNAVVGTALGRLRRSIAQMPIFVLVSLCTVASRLAIRGCQWATPAHLNELAAAALPSVDKPAAADQAGLQRGLAMATGESLSEAGAVLQQPAHSQVADQGKARAEEVEAAGPSATLSSTNSDQALAEALSGRRVQLDMVVLRPILLALGHALVSVGPTATSAGRSVRDEVAQAAKAIFSRASHDLTCDVLLASRSLVRLAALSTTPG
eukprot:SM000076S21843  [mRNA]  locus=s76:377759:379317:- [translate_table: standard]